MPNVELRGHLSFENNGMLVNNLVDKTNFSQRSDLWHPSHLKWESYYLNIHGVGVGSRGVSQ